MKSARGYEKTVGTTTAFCTQLNAGEYKGFSPITVTSTCANVADNANLTTVTSRDLDENAIAKLNNALSSLDLKGLEDYYVSGGGAAASDGGVFVFTFHSASTSKIVTVNQTTTDGLPSALADIFNVISAG